MRIPIWQGFDHYWQRESHRVNRFANYLTFDGPDPQGRGTHHSAMSIGSFPPDICHIHTMIHAIDLPDGGYINGHVSALAGNQLGQRAEVTGAPVSHTLVGEQTAAVILRGFEVHCFNFEHGFHTRGFGFLIQDVTQTVADGQTHVTFVPRFTMFAESSPDPFTDPDRLIWRVLPFPERMEPHSPASYAYRMTLHYSLIYAPAGRLNFMPSDPPVRLRYFKGASLAHARVRHEMAGQGGNQYQQATVGLGGFQWELLPRDTRFDGRYLRELQVMLEEMSYEPESGYFSHTARMWFTNSGGRGHGDTRQPFNFLRSFIQLQETPKKDRRPFRPNYSFEASFRLLPVLLQGPLAPGDPHPIRESNVLRRNLVSARPFSVPG